MTHADAGAALPHLGSTEPPDAAVVGARRPELQVFLLAGCMAVATLVSLLVVPNRGDAVEPTGWWAFVATAVMFGLFEFAVFNVQFRRQSISFSLSEIPIAFALVFLSPPLALLARGPSSAAVLIASRGNRGHKLTFNLCLVMFEVTLAALVFRGLLELTDGGRAVLLGLVVLSLMMVAPLTSVLISVAISRFEGDARERIVSELRATWWMYTVNAVLSAMTVSLALFEPALALLALLPAMGMWYVLQAYGEVSQELRDLDAVHGFAGHIGGTLDVDEIADVAAAEVHELLRAQGVALVRFAPDGVVVHTAGEVNIELPDDLTSEAWARVLANDEVQLLDRDRLGRMGVALEPAAPAALVAPIRDDGAVFAVLVAAQQDVFPFQFGDGDVARLRNMAQQLAVSLRRGMLHERLEFEARHDALTGLPARTLFESNVAEAVGTRDGGRVSCVLMLDIDRFKEVNDTLGHHAGDDLLKQFAARMTALLEPDDVLARLAGDEFAILCHRGSYDEGLEFAHTCVRQGGRPVVLDGLEIVVTVSVGVARIIESDRDALQPMRRADIAMYNAKWQRTGVEYYRDEIDRRTPARLSMLGDLRTAIEANELDVVYQPKLDLRTGHLVGAEALVRWEHSTRGVVAPAEFVRVAEDTGLIKEMTDLVLARGIEMLRRLRDQHHTISLAVNLSTHDLFDSRLPARVQGYLDDHGVDPSALTLEITESSLFVDAPRTRATIDDLHDVGLRMAVDDFGTGYSSLSYLRRLPVHELKIDQSFVSGMLTDPQDEVIVRSTVDLGHNLDLLVVAEGVEERAVLDRLREFGCDEAQGYYISPPITDDELIGWLERSLGASEPSLTWMGPLS
ncbi:MAG: sensor domain-containing phosphodiesterase [Ilumatobacter sp.]|uniref:putative bifunctional diguanylate cyclase/phosphodiesterase n=1 Tax=Ilumatobacter sp. TaxID=1967498 RepID=UPI002601730A|nr:sensor domain-containing phosphodiesterase [Ilumatobacter sp.]MDJ0770985.1 sensor domain-containing phosphodiesterase [Ilumatobacter sp.]